MRLIAQRVPRARKHLTRSTINIIAFLYVPSLILLFFAAGRMTMLSLSRGITQMPNYSSCTQAMVYPRLQAQRLVNLYEEKKVGFLDSILDEFANQNDLRRWAVVPSLFQHSGRTSHMDGDDKTTKKIWNFAFEREYNVWRLSQEHRRVVVEQYGDLNSPHIE
jgi:hypothetical protein